MVDVAAPATKVKKAATGGASFSPRLDPRPQYPPWQGILRKFIISYTRGPLYLALAVKAAEPLFRAAVAALRARGWSDRLVFALLFSGTHASTYALCNGFWLLADRNGWFPAYKLRAGKAQAPSAALIKETLREAFVGSVLLGPVSGVLVHTLFSRFGMPALDTPLPGLKKLVATFAFASLFNDVAFYWAHRTVHAKPLYARVHKQHHNFIETIGIAAEHATPVEQVFANYIPSLGGCMLLGAHPLAHLGWLVCRLQETYESHSGYYLGDTWPAKYLGLTNGEKSAFHFAHHLQNRGNFGGGSWMDWLFGTMDAWVASGELEGYLEQHLER